MELYKDSENEKNILKQYKESTQNLEDSKENLKKAKLEKKENKKKLRTMNKYISSDEFKNSENDVIKDIRSMNKERKDHIICEVLNSITHGIGVIFAIAAYVLLFMKANTKSEYIAYAIYATSLLILFLASTLYHSLIFTKARKVFRVIDHSSIFILIAGTYTPYCLVALPIEKGIPFLIVVWAIALFGILGKIFFFEKMIKINNILYLFMGWLCLFIIKDMIKYVSYLGLLLLLVGGIVYSLGVIFYKKKDNPYNHVIWHLFVFGGAFLMFLSVYLYV